eukprot:63035-Chlamydomonas_euryale.AAC.7
MSHDSRFGSVCGAILSGCGKQGSGWPGWHGVTPLFAGSGPSQALLKAQAGPGSGPKRVRQKDLCHTQVCPGGARGLFGRNGFRPGGAHLLICPIRGPLLQSGSEILVRCGFR